MKIKATFTSIFRNESGQMEDVVLRTMLIDWEDRRDVRFFAKESDAWLRRGPCYKVATQQAVEPWRSLRMVPRLVEFENADQGEEG